MVEPVYKERGTLEWPRDAPCSSWDELLTRTRGHLPNKTKQAEVNETGFVLTELPRAQVLPENLYRRVCHNWRWRKTILLGHILDLPSKINVYFLTEYHSIQISISYLSIHSKIFERAFPQTSLYCPPQSKISSCDLGSSRISSMLLGEWLSERKWSENAVGLEGRGGSVYWSSVLIKTVFKSSFRFTYVLFVVGCNKQYTDETKRRLKDRFNRQTLPFLQIPPLQFQTILLPT